MHPIDGKSTAWLRACLFFLFSHSLNDSSLRSPLSDHLQRLVDALYFHRELNRVARYLSPVVDFRVAPWKVHREGERNVVPIHFAVFHRRFAKLRAVGFAREL